MIERRVNDNKQKKNTICAGVVKTSPIQMDLKVKKIKTFHYQLIVADCLIHV